MLRTRVITAVFLFAAFFSALFYLQKMAENKGIFDKKDAEKTSEFKKVANSYRSGWQYAEIGFQYGASIVLCTLGGYWLDNWLDTGNIFLIIGVLFGSVAGFVNLMRSVNYKNKKTGKDGK